MRKIITIIIILSFLLIALNVTNAYARQGEGLIWSESMKADTSDYPNYSKIATNGKTQVLLGTQTYISNDGGLSWTTITNYIFQFIIFDGKQFVATTNYQNEEPALYTSTDGYEWTKVSNIPLPIVEAESQNWNSDGSKNSDISVAVLYKIVWVGNKYFFLFRHRNIIGQFSKEEDSLVTQWIMTSTDLKNWKQTIWKNKGIANRHLNDIAWNGKTFVGIGEMGRMAYSEDGINWSKTYLKDVMKIKEPKWYPPGSVTEEQMLDYFSYEAEFNEIVWDGKQFIAIGSISYSMMGNPSAVIFTSKDGFSWRKVYILSGKQINGEFVAFKKIVINEGKYYVFGGYQKPYVPATGSIYIENFILKSDNGINWDYSQRQKIDSGIVDAIFDRDRFVVIGSKILLGRSIQVKLNGNIMTFNESPQMFNGSTMVPLRGIFESLGASVTWQKESRTITVIKGDTSISLKIDSTDATVNSQIIKLKKIPFISNNGNTLVPLRLISEALGANVEWDDTTKTVIITSDIN